MTFTAKTCEPSRGGFTLIELVIVMVICALVLGGAVGMMALSSDEYAVKKATRETESLAKRARATAVLKQIPCALEFSPGMVRLMPWSEAIGEEELEDLREEDDPDEEAAANDPVRWELSLDNGMQAQMMRWDSDQWIMIEKGEKQVWRFDPDGLSEPIALKFSIDDSQVGMDFNPLTAAINPDTYIYE